jgi:hypothetical protein
MKSSNKRNKGKTAKLQRKTDVEVEVERNLPAEWWCLPIMLHN